MASKQLWRWHGITGDGNAQDGMLWAESRALLLMVIRQLISANTDVESLETHARQAGMRPLFENGCLAVEQGLTTFEELIRVLGMPHGE